MAGRPRTNDQPRGFVRIYVDLFPDTADALDVEAKSLRMSRRQLIHIILTKHLGVDKTHGTRKEK